MFELQLAMAKVPRHGTVESGDTLEMFERSGGGFSSILVDGQGSGRGAKMLSTMIITRAIALLRDGAHDAAVARGAHDYLYTYRMGQVAATLNILSVDFQSGTILMTRNNPAPFFVLDQEGVYSHHEPSLPIGLHATNQPQTTEIIVRPYLYVVMFTDGFLKAGEHYGEDLALGNFLAGWPTTEGRSADSLCDALLSRALELDRGKPSDDMTVAVMSVLPASSEGRIRRMQMSFQMERTLPNEWRNGTGRHNKE